MQTSKRNIGLDVLRALAILGVLLCHEVTLKIKGIDVFTMFGVGVELFFVLSGFLIGRIYFRSAQSATFSFWNFWRSRWWRTLPPYFAAIAVYWVVAMVYKMPPLHWYYAIFLQNYLGVSGFGPSWSLCVEEHFYLLLPVLGFLTYRMAGKRSWKILLPIAFFVPFLWRLAIMAKPLAPQWYWFSNLHCEGLIAGVWLAYNFVENPVLWKRLKTPATCLLPLAPLAIVVFTVWSRRPLLADMCVNTVFALGFTAWVRYFYDLEWAATGGLSKLFKSAAVGTALCSYSLYLTHTIVDPFIRSEIVGGLPRGVLRSAIVLFLVFLFGVGFYFLVERPTIRSRDRYLKREQAKPQLDAGEFTAAIDARLAWREYRRRSRPPQYHG